jgi:hypothetical protein
MESIKNLKFQNLNTAEMCQIYGGGKVVACDGKRRELLDKIDCVVLPDGSQVSIQYYGPTLGERISKGWKKTDAVTQCQDAAKCISVSLSYASYASYAPGLNLF